MDSPTCDVLRLALDLHRTFCKRPECSVLAQVERGLSRVATVGHAFVPCPQHGGLCWAGGVMDERACHKVIELRLPTPRLCGEPEGVHVPAKPVEQERFCNCGAENCTPFPAAAKPVEQHEDVTEEPCECCGAIECECSIGLEYGDDRETGPYSGKRCSEHGRAV